MAPYFYSEIEYIRLLKNDLFLLGLIAIFIHLNLVFGWICFIF